MNNKLSGHVLFDDEEVKMLYYALTGDELTEPLIKENYQGGEIYSVSVKLFDDIFLYVESDYTYHIRMYPVYDIEGSSVEEVCAKFKELMEHEQTKLLHIKRLTTTLENAILVSHTINYTRKK